MLGDAKFCHLMANEEASGISVTALHFKYTCLSLCEPNNVYFQYFYYF